MSVKQTGNPVITQNQHFPVLRFGYLEEVYCLIAYSPLRNDDGKIEGCLITISETTGQVLSDRRLKTLRNLGARASEARSPVEACDIAMEVFRQSNIDIPFAFIYLLDKNEQRVRLVSATGILSSKVPDEMSLFTEEEEWPFSQVLLSGPQQIHDLESRFGKLEGDYWPEPSREALVLPIASQTHEQPAGFLVAGISPRLDFNEQYQEFLTLVVGQVATSIANAKAYEQERMRAEALAKLDQAKTTFFSNVSHEFRTPLSLILGPLEDLLNVSDIKPEHHAQLDIIHRNALRLLKLVNSLLDFSRIESDRMQACYCPMDLAALTRDLASTFRSVVEKAGLKLVVHCPNLPSLVYIDRDMWEKIVLNLLSNAFKHTFEGKIEIGLVWLNDHVELSVKDTGVGIAAEQLPCLFERFHRVPNARSRSHEGTGIGLALVKELVGLHGGTIAAESIPEEGTTFTISIPTGKEHLPVEQIQTESTLPSTAISAQSFVKESMLWQPEIPDTMPSDMVSTRSSIVLAEDNADMLSYIKRLLDPFHDVIAVGNGKIALDIIQEQSPDLVLTDIMMPQLDGLGLLHALRQNPKTRTIPVIMLSARAGEEASVEGLEAGATDYLVKPFSANELLARIRTNLEMARIRKEAEEKVRQAEKLQVIGQLAGGMAHDFNSLLTVLLGRLEMLNAYVDEEPGQKMLNSAYGVAERSAKLIKQLLAFARKQPLYLEQVDLNQLILNMDDLLLSTLGKEIQIKKRLGDSIWPISVDINQVEMIILNLALNARDAMPQGGTLTLETQNLPSESMQKPFLTDAVLFSISDTGIGMSPEVLEHAFEPFFTTKNVGHGTGLGLSQVQGTVEQLGGKIQLYSTLGQGTKIEILLPRTL